MSTPSSTLLVLLFVLLVVIIAVSYVGWSMLREHNKRHKVAVGGGPFRLKVSDPEYTALLNGEKNIEARLDRPPFNLLAVGDQIVVIRSRPKGDESEYLDGKYKYDAEIVRIERYPSGIAALLKGEGAAKVYPGLSASEATARFNKYIPKETPSTEPVIAIELRALDGAKQKNSKKPAARPGRNYYDY